MKSIFLGGVLITCVVLGSAGSVEAQQNQNAPLTNASIVKLSRAGFKESTIITIIAARPTHFDLSPDRMIELKRSGVGEKIIVAMLARQEGVDPADDSWGDEAFTDETTGLKGSKSGSVKGSESGSIDIFGSSGGSKGRTRNRGSGGSTAEDTQTVGSATVRILRPPTEGEGPARLEKSPTLTNDSIVELVEAGFSEGTIIRRIEHSPVEFDLSPNQLAELRKHRVSEKILAAMKTATGEESTTKNPPGSDGTPKK